MPLSRITAHMVVKNEDRFLWYTIKSVYDFADRILIYDTGSCDKTIDIIKSLLKDDKREKIIFEAKGDVNSKDLVGLREEQIEKTRDGWIWIVDGDEIYPQKTAQTIIRTIKSEGDRLDYIIVRRFDLLGDVYHYQDESVGTYQLAGQKGHLVTRLFNKSRIPDLYVLGDYPNEYFSDKSKKSIHDRKKYKSIIVDERIFHAMYLKRSSLGVNLLDTMKRTNYKVEQGHRFSESFILPEVFYLKHPQIVPTVLSKRSLIYEILASIITPFKRAKRYLFKYLNKFLLFQKDLLTPRTVARQRP